MMPAIRSATAAICSARDVRAPALPRSPSGCAAASSNRARRDAQPLPCASPSTWNSTWRGRSTSRSRYTSALPKPRAAMERERSTASSNCVSSRAGSMPMPPPPPAGFTSTGKPISRAAREDRFLFSRQHVGSLGHRHAVARGELPRLRLVPHRVDPPRRRADETRRRCRSRAARTRAFSDRKP